MLLKKNGKRSSGKRIKHIEIRYYFVTDILKRSKLRIYYFPTENMIGDLFTRSLQGTLFQKSCRLLLNLPNEISGTTDDHFPDEQECVENSPTGTRESLIETSPTGTRESGIDTSNMTRCLIQISNQNTKILQRAYADILKSKSP